MRKVKRARTSSRTIGGHPKRFEKVVEWKNGNGDMENWNWFEFIFFRIPVFLILCWLIYPYWIYNHFFGERRNVYWREIK